MKKRSSITIAVILYIILLKYAFHILCPFLLALLCYFIVKPIIDYFNNKYHIHRNTLGLSLLFVIYLLIGLIMCLFCVYGCLFVYRLFLEFPNIYQDVVYPFIQKTIVYIYKQFPYLKQIDFSFFSEIIYQYFFSFITSFSKILTKVPSILFSFFIFILASFFLVVEYENMRETFFAMMSYKLSNFLMTIKNQCIKGLGIYMKCQVILMVITFIILYFVFCILKIREPFMLAIMTAILDSFPFIGIGIVLIPMSIFQIVIHEYIKGLYLFLLYLMLNMIRSILEPHIMNKQTKIPSFLLFLSMIIHLYIFGFIGVILSPIHLNVLYSLLDNKKNE